MKPLRRTLPGVGLHFAVATPLTPYTLLKPCLKAQNSGLTVLPEETLWRQRPKMC